MKFKNVFFKQNFPCSGSPYVLWSLSTTCFLHVVVFFLIVCFSTHRFAAIQACEQQLLQFRGLSGSLVRWLQTAQDQLPSKEANLNTEGLQRRVQQLKVN